MTSFVDFKQYGFWCQDEALRVWLSHAVQVLNRHEQKSSWQQQLSEAWQFNATLGCGGCLDLQLDYFSIDDERSAVIAALTIEVDNMLTAYGTSIPVSILVNWPHKMQGLYWESDRNTVDFLSISYLLRQLLAGKLNTTASSPPNHM